MKIIPILFSTPMVQALMDGRKTVTRRIVKPMQGLQSEWLTADLINKVPHGEIINGGWQMHHPKAGKMHGGIKIEHDSPLGWVKCPYGDIGDTLWVKEAHYAFGWWLEEGFTKMGKQKWRFNDLTLMNDHDYKFLEKPPSILEKGHSRQIGWYKRSSLFMPKIACRTFLKITDIKVERIQSISKGDAIKEGIQPLLMSRAQLNSYGQLYRDYSRQPEMFNEGCSSINSFKSLWFSINGEESWNANSFVWCISFEKTDKPLNFIK